MADEVRASGTLVYEDSEGTEASLQSLAFLHDVATKKITRTKQNVGITEEAIDLGDIASPGFALFINRDTTNFISLKAATGGAIFAKLRPGGGFALLELGSGAQAPWATADSAACQMDVFIISQ